MNKWQLIDSAPKTGEAILLYAPGKNGLPHLYLVCGYDECGGWTIDELRDPTHWMPLPEPPEGEICKK